VLEISNTAVLFIRPAPDSAVQAFEARDAPSELSQGVSQSRRQLQQMTSRGGGHQHERR
jgi:hypothetical protein